MSDEYIRLDTTIIGIEGLINKASTVAEASALYTAKSVIYSQQRYGIDVQPLKQGHWIEINEYGGWGDTYYRCSICGNEWGLDAGKWNGCPICLARMDGDTECHDTK